jgi:hypothetical protein
MASAVKFSAADRARIIAEARARAEDVRQHDDHDSCKDHRQDDVDPLAAAYALDNASKAAFARHQAEQVKAEPDIIFKTILRQPRRADALDVDQKLAAVEAKFVTQMGALRDEMCALRDDGLEATELFIIDQFEKAKADRRDDLLERRDDLRALKLEVTELATVVAELRVALAVERSKTIDLPNVLSARQRMQ